MEDDWWGYGFLLYFVYLPQEVFTAHVFIAFTKKAADLVKAANPPIKF